MPQVGGESLHSCPTPRTSWCPSQRPRRPPLSLQSTLSQSQDSSHLRRKTDSLEVGRDWSKGCGESIGSRLSWSRSTGESDAGQGSGEDWALNPGPVEWGRCGCLPGQFGGLNEMTCVLSPVSTSHGWLGLTTLCCLHTHACLLPPLAALEQGACTLHPCVPSPWQSCTEAVHCKCWLNKEQTGVVQC